MDNKHNWSDLLKFQVSRCLTNQATQFLVILEDLLEETGGFNYNIKRKRVLDNMNNNIREMEKLIEKFNINLTSNECPVIKNRDGN